MDQPQPTKQKRTQKNWDTATIMLMMKAPILARALSNWEKRGMPTHRQKSPESKVPVWGRFGILITISFPLSLFKNPPNPGKTTLQKAQNQAK